MGSGRWMLAGPAPAMMGALFSLAACAACATLTSLSTAGCGTTAPKGPTPPTASAQPATPEDAEATHHRMRHHGGVASLIAMSIKDVDLTAEQKATVEKIRADLKAKAEPARAAGEALAAVLADGIAAGAVSREKADAAIDTLVSAVETMQAAAVDAMNQLHATLTPAQRAKLVDGMQARAAKWHESHGDEDDHAGAPSGHGDHAGRGMGQAGMFGGLKDLNLTDDQKAAIRSNLRDTTKGGPPHDHKEMQEHLDAFGTAFKSDTFDAKTLDTGARRAATHMARWGATRFARFCEAAAPVLTAEQRTKLSASIKDHGTRKDS